MAGGAFVVTPAAITFTAVQNGQLPAPQSIHIHRDDTKATFGSSWAKTIQITYIVTAP
jgi:hypothetical protein